MDDKTLSQLLNFDPLAEAEEVTKKSYKSDDSTMGLGIMLLQFNAKAKQAALEAQDDTTFSNKLDRYLRIVESEGFVKIMDEPIPDDPRRENFGNRNFAFWHPRDGILLHFDTYLGTDVNGGNFYYNWKPNEGVNASDLRMSHGGFGGDFTDCSMDCREALRFNLRRLRKLGQFANPWVKRGFLWLLHYEDTRGGHGTYDHEAINAERIAKFPEEVRKAICV